MRDMALINHFESEFCAPLILRHPQIRNRLGLASLVNVLMDNFEIHLKQHVLPNLEAAGTGIRNSAIFYRDSLGVLINESNYAQVLELFTIRGRALKKFPEIFEGVLGDLAYYEVDTVNRVEELYNRYADAETNYIVTSTISEALPWYLSKYGTLADFMRLVVKDLLAGVDLRILEDDLRFAIRYQRLYPSLTYPSQANTTIKPPFNAPFNVSTSTRSSGGVRILVHPKVVFHI